MDKFQEDFTDYTLSGHAMLVVETYEKDRAIGSIRQAAISMKRNLVSWSISTGWNLVTDVTDGHFSVPEDIFQPEVAVQTIPKMPENTIFVLRDFGVYLSEQLCSQFDLIISWLDTIKQIVSNQGQIIVFLGPSFQTPDVLKHDITIMDFPLPQSEDIEKHINYICESVEKEDGSKIEVDKSMLDDVVSACQGMTQQKILDKAALSLRKHKDFNSDAIATIVSEKASTIRTSGLVNYIEAPPGGLNNIGGYDQIKQHIMLDQPCFSQEAKDFGISNPRGLLLVGVPGAGKTHLSMSIASQFGYPLLSLDFGQLFGSLVGESEKNLRDAIKIIESIGRAVVLCDEFEKSLASGSEQDGGSTKRVLSTFLQWMNNRTSPIYLMATCNKVDSLAPETMRSGRFDAIFFLDIPNFDERNKIFDIHITKVGRNPNDFDINKLSKLSDGFVGSDIENVIRLALKLAFSSKEELSQKYIESAIQNIIPLSATEPERIQKIRDWGKKHAKSANSQTTIESTTTKRKVVV